MNLEQREKRNHRIKDIYEQAIEDGVEDPLGETYKKFKNQCSLRTIQRVLNEESELYPPSDHMKILRDAEGVSSLTADELIDKEHSAEYGDVIDSLRLQNLVKNAEKMGLDTKTLFVNVLEYTMKNQLTQSSIDDTVAVMEGVPINEIIKRPIKDITADKIKEAKYMKAEAEIKRAENDISAEDINTYKINKLKDVIIQKELYGVDNEDTELDLYFNEEHKEFYNDLLHFIECFENPNISDNELHSLERRFMFKWNFKFGRSNELRERKKKKEQEQVIDQLKEGIKKQIYENELRQRNIRELTDDELLEIYKENGGKLDRITDT